jgi:two-component system CheB/CheR fusion protein
LYPVPDALPALRDKNIPAPSSHETGNRGSESISYGNLHQQLLEQYASPSLVINEKYDVVHVSEGAAHYLQMTGGEPSSNLLKLIRQELRLELRNALYQATQRKTSVEARSLQVHFGERTETINIHVRPVLRESDPSRSFLLVLFEPAVQVESDEERVFTSDESVARQLEQELIRLKVEIRTTTEQYELQSEELKASNEELQALNEELRSAAEELETSREELQSINEELITVNQELKVKIEEVSQTSNNLHNLINSTNIATIFLDRRLRIHLFSPAARGIFNLLSSDIGRPLSDITHKLQYAELLEDAGNVIEKLDTVERQVRTTEGRNFLMRLSPYRTSDDRIQGVVATFTDMTERQRAEEAVAADLKATTLLRELSARLVPEGDIQMLYQEIMAAAIALMRADGGTVQVLDHETGELVILASQGFEQNMKDRFHRVDATSNTPCGIALARNERILLDLNVAEHDDPDGSMRMHVQAGYYSAQSTPLVARYGKPIGMVSTYWRKQHRPGDRELRFLDLLARQAADLIEQRQTDEVLRESDRRKDEFLATLAHELRNPLAPIKNGLQIAQLKIPTNSPLTHTLEVMDRQLDHLVHLVDDLLDVARISSGKLKLRQQRVALREALASSIECIQPLIDAHKHELIADLGSDELFVEGDFDRLSQVFSNLLSNAAKYTERGGCIRIFLTQEGNEAVVKVTDTGIGIDTKDLKHVFDLFSQVTSSQKLTEGGLGIGLSLIRTLVQLHGGTIAAESEGLKAGGSTFIVRLPLSQNSATPGPLPQSHPVQKSEAPLRILVVDDNVDAGVVLAMLLEIDGHKVEVVHNGKDAVKKAEAGLPDIIFLDLGMPEMDGIEAARHLRALPGGDRIFLVALTGWGQEKDRQRTKAAGFDSHLVKPVDNGALEEMLSRFKH